MLILVELMNIGKNGFHDPNNIYFDGSHFYISKKCIFGQFLNKMVAILDFLEKLTKCYQMHSIMQKQMYNDIFNKNTLLSED